MTEFTITLPATSANLGPAFDAAALAMDLGLRIRATRAKVFSIVASGRDADICGKIEKHLILSTYRDVLTEQNKTAPPLALTIHNGFPIGKGFGSSAAARILPSRRGREYSEFNAPAGGAFPGQPQPAGFISRRPHSPALQSRIM